MQNAKPAPASKAANEAKQARPSKSERKKRQSELLDEALLETFPASDPVSIYLKR